MAQEGEKGAVAVESERVLVNRSRPVQRGEIYRLKPDDIGSQEEGETSPGQIEANNDCASLPLSAIDLKAGWLDFPRPKTGIPRRCPLWPETVEALKAAIAERYEPKDPAHRGLLFITKRRKTWSKDTSDNPVSKETTKLLKELGLHREGLSFYALRHTFETIGGAAKDQVAVDAIMGHAPEGDDMAAVYRET